MFDIKQAANIDDQTMLYMAQNGFSQLEGPLKEQLEVLKEDLFSEKSLDFYRGRQTKEELEAVDDKLKLVIRLLAPHLMEPAVHKLLEFLIRIFEVHIHQKHLLLTAWLPYFETVYFLKLI